jgi:glycosyltransferase involved in cell wall biosynthesis
VVVPTRNQAEYLPACLDSIWFQEYAPLEIIVVADPSEDDTSGVLAAYREAVAGEMVSHARRLDAATGDIARKEHPRYPAQGRTLRIVENADPRGQTGCYNQGLELARGEYFTYVASDDTLYPHMVSSLAAVLEDREADFAYSDMLIVDDQGRVEREFRLPDYSFQASFCDWYLCGVSKLYRRSLHEAHGPFDPAWAANDHECYLRFALGGARFAHLGRLLYAVRSHRDRAVGAHEPERFTRLLKESGLLVQRARQALEQGLVRDHGRGVDRT